MLRSEYYDMGVHAFHTLRALTVPYGNFYRELDWNQWRHDQFERSGPPLVIIGGMFNFRVEILDPMLHWYLSHGYNAYAIAPKTFAHYMYNLRYVSEQLNVIEKHDRSFRESKEIILVGYSLGGVLSFMLSMKSDEWSDRIWKVVSLGTPFVGGIAGRPGLKKFVFKHTGISEHLLTEQDSDGKVTAHAVKKLINLASDSDFIAPCRNCFFPNARGCVQENLVTRLPDDVREVHHHDFLYQPAVHQFASNCIQEAMGTITMMP